MRIESYTIIHYGSSYVGYALKSILDQVDLAHVIYTPNPSHGHSTKHKNPDTREEIIEAIRQNCNLDKIQFYDSEGVTQEGKQRDAALELCYNADVVLVVDCDEIWDAGQLKSAIDHVKSNRGPRNWLVNMYHFWRSFDYACTDNNWPVRFIDNSPTEETGYIPFEIARPYHFGYAVTDEIMQYKWKIHGHKQELRDNWLNDIWPQWPPSNDCHPTNGNNWWTPERFDKSSLPEFMKNHRFYNLEVIR